MLTDRASPPMAPSYYEVLGVTEDADDVVIAAAYRALMKKYHPDANGEAGAKEQAAEINRAFARLSDPMSRIRYDARLKAARSREITLAPSRAARSWHDRVARLGIFALLVGAALAGTTAYYWSSSYTVTASGLNCRRDAREDSPVIEQLGGDTPAEVAGSAGGWTRLERPAGDCWVKSGFLAQWPDRDGAAIAPPVRVALEPVGGEFSVPVRINGAQMLELTVDADAPNVTLSRDVLDALLRKGIIRPGDLGPHAPLAEGQSDAAPPFVIRSLQVGGVEIQNVRASAAPSGGPLLLGQSALQQFDAWSIDKARSQLLLYAPARSPGST